MIKSISITMHSFTSRENTERARMKSASFSFRIARAASNSRKNSVVDRSREARDCAMIYIASHREGKSSASTANASCGWCGGGRLCSPRRSWTCDHLQRGEITWQVTNAAAPIKAMKEPGWDRRLVAPQRGPTTKAEPSVGGFPPFMPAFRFFYVPSTITTAGTGSSSRDPGANRSILLCVEVKIKKKRGKRSASRLFVSAPRGKRSRVSLVVLAKGSSSLRESEESIL